MSLAETVNNIPYVVHGEKSDKLVEYSELKNTPYFTVLNSNGLVSVYNTDLQIVEVISTNFKEEFSYVKPRDLFEKP